MLQLVPKRSDIKLYIGLGSLLGGVDLVFDNCWKGGAGSQGLVVGKGMPEDCLQFTELLGVSGAVGDNLSQFAFKAGHIPNQTHPS